MSAALADARPYWLGVGDVPWSHGRSVVTLGVFDGLHRGHARLLGRAVELGERRGHPVVLTTFDPHPATVAGRARDTTPVVGLEERAALAREHGADAVLVLPFGEALARTPAVEFVREVLVRGLRATDVVVGENFRFGHRGVGDLRLLRRLGPRHGFTAHGVPLVPGCSSTRVRQLVAAGDVAGAATVLGRPHRIRGQLDRGIVHPTTHLLPPPGCYIVRVGDITAPAEVAPDATIRLHALVPPGPITLDLLRRSTRIADRRRGDVTGSWPAPPR